MSKLYKKTHTHKDGTFVDARAEKIHNDVQSRIQEVETQLSQENPDLPPVQLSTVEQDKIFEQVIYFFKYIYIYISSII